MKRASLIAASFLLTLSCNGDKSPATPTPPPAVPVPVFTNLILSPAVQKIPPGQTVQLTATARYSDGSSKDVTTQTAWTSFSASIARVSAGAVTGVALGRVTIQARFSNFNTTLTIVVEPDGTFILKGKVTEPGNLGVGGVTVEASTEPRTQGTTSSTGSYEIFGLGGTLTIRIRKAGYNDETRILEMGADQTLDVIMAPTFAPASVAGTYRATFTAPASCTNLPTEMKIRTYTATIVQNGAQLTITLSDAQFVSDFSGLHNRFDGRVLGNQVTLNVGDGYYVSYYGSPVEELVPNSQYLAIWGTITVPFTSPFISTTFAGGFTLKASNRYTSCVGSDARVELTRQ